MCGERGGCGSEEHEEHDEHDEHTHTTRKVKARLLSPVANRSNPTLSRGARLEGTLEPNRRGFELLGEVLKSSNDHAGEPLYNPKIGRSMGGIVPLGGMRHKLE